MLDTLNQMAKKLSVRVGYYIQIIFKDPDFVIDQFNYDSYWQIRGKHEIQPRFPLISKLIKKGSSVCDLGCGDGSLLEYLKIHNNVVEMGYDISDEALKIAKCRGIRVGKADFSEPSFCLNGTYDYIVISEVLEHLVEPERLLLKVKKNVDKLIIVSIPNIAFLPHRIRLALGKFPIQWSFHPSEHLRFWSVNDFVKWTQKLGFRILGINASNGIPILNDWWPNLFADQVVFILTPNTKIRSIL